MLRITIGYIDADVFNLRQVMQNVPAEFIERFSVLVQKGGRLSYRNFLKSASVIPVEMATFYRTRQHLFHSLSLSLASCFQMLPGEYLYVRRQTLSIVRRSNVYGPW